MHVASSVEAIAINFGELEYSSPQAKSGVGQLYSITTKALLREDGKHIHDCKVTMSLEEATIHVANSPESTFSFSTRINDTDHR